LLSFFLLSWLYLWLRVDTRLIYFIPDSVFPSFSLNAPFLGAALSRPGGLSDYASAFLSQLLYYPWVGALVIAAVAALLCACAGAFIASLAGQRPRLAHFLPGVLLLLAYGRYIHALDLAVSLLGAVVLACAYVRIPWRNAVMRLAAFTALSAACYYLGGGVVSAFAALCATYEAAAGRAGVGAAGLAASAALPYAIGVAGFGLRLSEAYVYVSLECLWKDFQSAEWPVPALCVAVPLTAAIVAVFARLRGRRARASAADGAIGRLKARLTRRRTALAGRIALCVGAAFAVWLSPDGQVSADLRMRYLDLHGKWGGVLRQARKVHPTNYSFLDMCAVNRALYHEGRLLDDMFRYPQHPNGLLLSQTLRENDVLQMPPAMLQLGGTFYDLGLMNDAVHMFQDATEFVGPRPWVLKRLALSEGIKGRMEARELYLQSLRSDLIYGRWAARVLSGAGNDSEAQAREVEAHSALMPFTDSTGTQTTEKMLTNLLEGNRQNRMAFEYLMAYYLLIKHPEDVAENLGRLDDFGYPRIPRLCEEAIMLYTKQTGKRVDLHGRSISNETILRFAKLSDILKRCAGDRAVAAQAVQTEFPYTYFYYYPFVSLGEPR
jgi:hypothetical protein